MNVRRPLYDDEPRFMAFCPHCGEIVEPYYQFYTSFCAYHCNAAGVPEIVEFDLGDDSWRDTLEFEDYWCQNCEKHWDQDEVDIR